MNSYLLRMLLMSIVGNFILLAAIQQINRGQTICLLSERLACCALSELFRTKAKDSILMELL